MAIFSRRSLQRMTDSNARFLSAEATKRHVRDLNRCEPESISAEWEVAILYGLSVLGTVQHEPEPQASARLDVHFRREADPAVAFTGDVLTVFDFGIEKQNPQQAFMDELARRAKRIGITLAGFGIHIGRREEGGRHNRKVFLSLPPKARIEDVFDEGFDEFLIQVRDEHSLPHRYQKLSQEIEIVMTYTPGERYVSGSGPSYGIPMSPTRNPLHNSLKRKADQLKRATRSETTVLFACDGGSDSIRGRFGHGIDTYSPSDIVRRFFRDHSVSAVCLLTIEPTASPRSILPFSGPLALRVEVFSHPRVPESEAATLRDLLERLPQLVPPPVDDATNAINHLRWRDRRIGRSFRGGHKMSGNHIKLSARAVQELLAGRISAAKFEADHHWKPGDGSGQFPNPFETALTRGRLIDRITVETCPDQDDDWLVFHFSREDQAIAPFRIPEPVGP